MKQILKYIIIGALPFIAVSCKDKEDAPGTLRGVFYADIPGDKALVEIAPDASKTYNLRAYAHGDNVADVTMTFSFKADPDRVEAYNAEKGTSYQMCPGSAYEFVTNEVMMPRYGKASTTARLKVSASGLEDGVSYILPVTIDKAIGTDNWEIADTLAAYVLLRKSDFDPNGPGTENNPHVISTVDDLKAMGSKLIEGSMVYFKMDADIDMTGVTEWTPVNESEPYKKFDFDGDGHTISNYTGTTSLFGAVVGKCHDLNVTGANITNGPALPVGILGAYCGAAGMPTEVSNVYVSGKITNTTQHGTGGLFGVVCEATINACAAECVLTSNKYDVGSIFGYDTGKSTVTNCWGSGEVRGNRYIGGIAGALMVSESSVYNSYSTTRVYGQFQYGGIVGHANANAKDKNKENNPKNHIEKCIAWNEIVTTTITDNSAHYSAGAIVGYTAVKNYHVDCYRRADLDFTECPANSFNVLYDQPNSNPDSPLAEVEGTYNFPYHGKAAPADATASQVAKTLGWDENIWVLTGTLPYLKGGSAPVENPDVNTGGQLPDFGDNEFYK